MFVFEFRRPFLDEKVTTSGSHFGTLGAPGASFLSHNGVAPIDLLLFVSKMRSAVPLWAPKDAKRVPQGSPRDPQGRPKVAQGHPKTPQGPQNPRPCRGV